MCGINSKLNYGILYEYIEKFDIFCVTESKVSKGPIIDNYTVFNLEKKSDKYPLPGVHGLQVYIADHMAAQCNQLSDIIPAGELVLWIKIADNFILGTLYIPHEGSIHRSKTFYTDLALEICEIKRKYNMPIMLIGDLNSRTGTLNDIYLIENNDDVLDPSILDYPEIVNTLISLNIPINRSNKDTTVNNNGKKLIELCKCHDLCIVNGRIGSDKHIGNTTFDGTSLIDYVICTPDLLANITNFTVDDFDPLCSDKHSPIHLNVDLAKPSHHTNNNNTNKNETNNTHYITCKWDSSKKDEFQKNFDMSKIQNMVISVSSVNLTEATQATIENISLDLKNILIDPAKKTEMYRNNTTKPKNKKPNSNKPFFNTACKTSRQEYNKFKKTLKGKPKVTKNPELNALAKKHKKLIRREKRNFDKELNKKLITLKSTNPGEYWKIINNGKKKIKTGNIPLNTLFDHFHDLNKSKTNANVNIPDSPIQNSNESINRAFTIDEINKHINSLKNNKSPGIDNILNEFIKYSPKELIVVIVKFFNIILDTGIIPNDWTIGVIKPLYKNKGDINDVNNYRGITLLSCIGKLFTSVLNARLYAYLTSENILGNEQAGFRPKHSTLDHIFALHILSKFYIDQKKQLFCAFVDYSKAFDFIDRVYLWQKLLKSNINGKTFNVIKNMYQNAKSHVSFKNELSDPFPCEVGVRQGENLSPLLFAIYLNDFNIFLSKKYNGLTKVTDSISKELQIYLKIFSLLYADDTIILAESAPDLQKALDGLYSYCSKWALNINIDKTKVIIFSKGKIRKFKYFKLGDKIINVVDDYVYLGTTFNYNGTFSKAKSKQTLQAKKATYSLFTRINQLNLTFETSIELFERLTIPVLLYGSEIWGHEEQKQLQTMFNTVMRRFLKLHKSTPMCMINGELGTKEIEEYTARRMLNFWFNIATGEDSKISTILYKWIKTLHDQNKYKSVWIVKVKTILDQIGMTNLFHNTTNTNKNEFKNITKSRLNNIYTSKWSDTVHTNSVCINYRSMTVIKNTQNYIKYLPKQYAYALCKFKCANHHLPIVEGRYGNTPIDERKCTLCRTDEIGDEFHYLFNCKFFQIQRIKYIRRYYYTQPNTIKLTQLFESPDYAEMLDLAKFTDIIMKHFRTR